MIRLRRTSVVICSIAFWTTLCAVINMQCSLCNVQLSMCNVYIAMCNIHFALCNWAGTRHSDTGHRQFPQFAAAAFKFNFTSIRATSPLPLYPHNTPPRNTQVHKYTLVFDNISNRKSCIAKSRRIPRRGATLKFTSTPRMQGRCCGRGPMFNFQTTLWTLGGWWQIQNTQNTKWKYKITDAKLSSSCWSCVV